MVILVKFTHKEIANAVAHTYDLYKPIECDFCKEIKLLTEFYRQDIFGHDRTPVWFCSDTCTNLFILKGEPLLD